MKRYLIKLATGIILMAIVGALVFTGCAEEEEPPPPPPPPVEEEEEPPPPPPPVEEVWEWPDLIPVLAPPVGSMGYGTMVGWTALLQEDSGMQVRCVPAGSGLENHLWLKEGRFLWYVSEASDAALTLEGKVGFAARDLGPYQMRTIWPTNVSFSGFVVRGDSDIKTPRDIRPGTKVAFSPATAMTKVVMDALIAWSGVDPEDIVWVPYTGFWTSLDMVADGRADITFSFPSAPKLFEQEASPNGIAWLDLDPEDDPEGAERFLDVWPTIGFGVNQTGCPSSIGMKGLITITVHFTEAQTDTELIYQICKWLWENYDSYQDISPTLAYHDIDTVMKMVEIYFVPAHDGLVKYLKEIGKWTPAHDARQEASLDLLTRYIEAYQTAIDMADDEGIQVDPTNEEWLELWENYKKELGLPKFKLFASFD